MEQFSVDSLINEFRSSEQHRQILTKEVFDYMSQGCSTIDSISETIKILDKSESSYQLQGLTVDAKIDFYTQLIERLGKENAFPNKMEETLQQLYLLYKSKMRYDMCLQYLMRSKCNSLASFYQFMGHVGYEYLLLDYEINIRMDVQKTNAYLTKIIDAFQDFALKMKLIDIRDKKEALSLLIVFENNEVTEIITTYQQQRFFTTLYAISQLLESDFVDVVNQIRFKDLMTVVANFINKKDLDLYYIFEIAYATGLNVCQQDDQAIVHFLNARGIAQINFKHYIYELLQCSLCLQQIYMETDQYREGLEMSLVDLDYFDSQSYEIGLRYKEEFDLFKYNLKFFYVAMGQ